MRSSEVDSDAHIIHDGLQQVFHDGAEASRAGAALPGGLGDGPLGRLCDVHARPAHAEHPLVLLC